LIRAMAVHERSIGDGGGDRELAEWVDRRVLDRHGEAIGVVVDLYDDSVTGRAKWLVVSTGFFGTRRTITPVQSASLFEDVVVVAYPKDVIVSAPPVHPFTAISATDERAVIAHYARHGTLPTGSPAERQIP
jgi:hypothetical protein